MSVRVLTIQEMYDLADGAEAVFVDGWDTIESGTPLTRNHDPFDDSESVRFDYKRSNGVFDYEYFSHREVGLVEPTAALGVFRPELVTRKVGKIRVDLVDEGFPLALRAIAKVMTWAQTVKGYKDHDWQNLPNAEVELAAAASRHRTDHIEQRVVKGLDIDQCLDVESSLHHKAHEAFGVLAQLELMLRGKFVDKHPAHKV